MEENQDFNLKKKILLEGLVKRGYLKDKRLFKAFLEVPLEAFIEEKYRDPLRLYEDQPNVFYYQNRENYRTISAPHMCAIMLEGLALEAKDDLLILGAKSGYITALARSLAPKGKIVILEANGEIARITKENLERLELDENISIIVKNPLEGMPESGPWKKILVTGAIQQDKISHLLKQLDTNEGVLYAPIEGDSAQVYTQILRINDEYFGNQQLQVIFTPLMTQIELDELELITDVEEIEIIDDPNKVDETLNRIKEKVRIKYESRLPEHFSFKPITKIEPKRPIGSMIIVKILENIARIIKILKRESAVNKCFDFIEDIEAQLYILKNYKSQYNLDINKIQESLNQIRTYNILRKDFENVEMLDDASLKKKFELVNEQLEQINFLNDFLREEINKLKKRR